MREKVVKRARYSVNVRPTIIIVIAHQPFAVECVKAAYVTMFFAYYLLNLHS